jgi:hyaluronoglucosaminidase
VLWDNYPVNDGQRMSQSLHLRGFTGRPAGNAPLLRAHAINPALQPVLGCIPALTLARRYRDGEAGYAYGAAFAQACREVLGVPLADAVRGDLIPLQDTGLDRLGDLAAALRERYAAFDHPAAREILDWLDGGWRITDEIVQTQ